VATQLVALGGDFSQGTFEEFSGSNCRVGTETKVIALEAGKWAYLGTLTYVDHTTSEFFLKLHEGGCHNGWANTCKHDWKQFPQQCQKSTSGRTFKMAHTGNKRYAEGEPKAGVGKAKSCVLLSLRRCNRGSSCQKKWRAAGKQHPDYEDTTPERGPRAIGYEGQCFHKCEDILKLFAAWRCLDANGVARALKCPVPNGPHPILKAGGHSCSVCIKPFAYHYKCQTVLADRLRCSRNHCVHRWPRRWWRL